MGSDDHHPEADLMSRGKANTTDVLDDIIAGTARIAGPPAKVPRLIALLDAGQRERINELMASNHPQWSDRRMADILCQLMAALGHDETISATAVHYHRKTIQRG